MIWWWSGGPDVPPGRRNLADAWSPWDADGDGSRRSPGVDRARKRAPAGPSGGERAGAGDAAQARGGGMILADTSIWVDHLRAGEPRLASALSAPGHPVRNGAPLDPRPATGGDRGGVWDRGCLPAGVCSAIGAVEEPNAWPAGCGATALLRYPRGVYPHDHPTEWKIRPERARQNATDGKLLPNVVRVVTAAVQRVHLATLPPIQACHAF